jgi:lipopolysaccharide export system permease protein
MSPSSGYNLFQLPKVKLPKLVRQKDIKFSDSLFNKPESSAEISAALSKARMVKNQLQNINTNIDSYQREYRVFEIQWNKILANSIACIAMFLIGAPLGAIIKKGGLGMPVLASIMFFIFFYVLSITGDKWALAETLPVPIGTWMSNAVLFIIGLIFLRQARADARLFEADFYNVVIDKFKQRWQVFSSPKPKSI